MPNLDIAAESKRKILYYLAIMNRQGIPGAQAYLGFTYNPYLTRELYALSYTRQIMDMKDEVLIGNEFWDFIGGSDTYDELLEVIEEVRKAL